MCEVEFWEVFLVESARVFNGGWPLKPPTDCQIANLELFGPYLRQIVK